MAGTALVAAREYLEKFGGVLGIAPSELSNFGLPAETSPVDAGVEYRFDQEKPQFDTTTIVLAQTYFGLPVWEAPDLILVSQCCDGHPELCNLISSPSRFWLHSAGEGDCDRERGASPICSSRL